MAILSKVLERVDKLKPNKIPPEIKTKWLSDMEGQMALDVFLMDQVEAEQLQLEWPRDKDRELMVAYPHDSVYDLWLAAKIDYENGEYNKYENTVEAYDKEYARLCAWFVRVYRPANGNRCQCPPYYLTAYGLAVMMGFTGTLEQWLGSLHGDGIEMRYKAETDMIQYRPVPRDSTAPDLGPEEGWVDVIQLDLIRDPAVAEIVQATLEARNEAVAAKVQANAAAAAAAESEGQAENAAVAAGESNALAQDAAEKAQKSAAAAAAAAAGMQAAAVCHDPAAPESSTPNTWYVPKTMPRPSGAVGMMVDVFWENGRSDGLGYDIRLVWGEPGGADNEIIVDTASTTDSLTGEYSVPAEGTVRYQLEEVSGRKHWRYVSGPLIPKQFSTATAAATADKAVPGMSISYLPGMEIYVQLDNGNSTELMRLVPDDGPTLPVYGNGTGATTGTIPAGAILHLINAGDHWQIVNGGGAAATNAAELPAEVPPELDPETEATAQGVLNALAKKKSAGGVTKDQATALDGMFKITAFTVPDANKHPAYLAFQAAFGLGAPVPATKVTLVPTSLKFTDSKSKVVKATVEPSNTTDKVVWSTNASSVASVQGGVVNPVGNGDAIITATAGSASATCAVNVNIAGIKKFSVTNNLTNCSTGNATVEVVEGGSYEAMLTADEGYTLDGATVIVSVSGIDIADTAYRDGKITIPNVLGDIIITATAVSTSKPDDIVLGKSVMTDGAAWIDLGFYINTLDHKLEFGYYLPQPLDQTKDERWGLLGRSMYDYGSSYSDFFFEKYLGPNTSNQRGTNVVMGRTTGEVQYTNGSTPFGKDSFHVVDFKNKIWRLYLDSEMSKQPTYPWYKDATLDLSAVGDLPLPIKSWYIFRVQFAKENKTTRSPKGTKWYYFRDYSPSGELLHDVRAAKKGGEVGMYDLVTKMWLPAKGGALTFEEANA